MNTIGSRIIYLREELDISQVKLATSIGVTKATMSKYENDICIPKADITGKIADVLNTTTDYLIGRITSNMPFEKNENWVKLNVKEMTDIYNYRLLNYDNKIRISERIEVLLEIQNKK